MKSIGKLELIAFVVGFCLLAYELVAARVLAPSIGSSVYVWTSVIGVIIAALSLGFWMGGKIADARSRITDIVWLLLFTGLAVMVTKLLYATVLQNMITLPLDVRVLAVLAATLLFAPASFCIGLISPYLAKLNISSLSVSGRKIASLSAFDSIGGITGTFLTGFFLIGWLGSHETFGVIGVLLMATSWLIKPKYRMMPRLWFSIALFLLALLPHLPAAGVIAAVDTPSAHYEVRSFTYKDRQISGLITGPRGIQSSVYVDNPNELVFWYNRQMAKLTLEQKPARVLVLGGGAFTLPEYLGKALPDSKIDVVEIDPKLEGISEKYFGFTHPANVRTIFDDARRYLERTDNQYDVVLVDVYGDAEIPFSMLTKEYAAALERHVAEDGVVIVNLIAGQTGACKEIFVEAHAVYSSQFGFGYTSTEPGVSALRENNILLYSRQPHENQHMKELALSAKKPLSDNAAPVEQLYYNCVSDV